MLEYEEEVNPYEHFYDGTEYEGFYDDLDELDDWEENDLL